MLSATPQTEVLVKESIDRLVDNFQQKRKSKLRLYWDYYFGRHYFNIANERGEPIYGVGKKRVKINLCKYAVDESLSALFPSPPDIASYSAKPELKEKAEDELKRVWQTRDGARRLRELGIMGGVTGDCYLKLVFDKETESVRVNILDSEWVTPVFAGDNDIERLAGLIIDYLVKPAKGRSYRYTEVITPDYVRILHDGKVVSMEENGYGFMPIVHIKNVDIPNSFCGLSDIEQIYQINDEINYAFSDRANALYYHGNPILTITGAGAGDVKVGSDRCLILPDEKSKAEYLKRDTDFESLNKHIAELRSELLRLARLPEEIPANSGNLSGVALAMLQAPLIKLVADKRATYGGGLEKANEIILKILVAENVIPELDDYRTDVIFADYLPVDEKMRAEADKLKIDSYASLVAGGFMSRETAMSIMADQGLLTIADINAEIKKIKAEQEADNSMIFPKGYQERGNGDNGSGS